MSLFSSRKKTEEVKQAPKEEKPAPVTAEKPKELPPESTFLLDRKIHCVVCDKTFSSKSLKSKSATRLDSDYDLRPRFKQLDTLKYDVYSCPYCGYSAVSSFFDHLTAGQIKLVLDNITSKFQPSMDPSSLDSYDYDLAVDRYKRALECAVVKRGKISEIAYTNLKLAWIYRGMAEALDSSSSDYAQKKTEYNKLEEEYYEKAFDGFMEAVAKEDFPICGMDQPTLDYLLAAMASHFKKYDTASKCLSNIQSSPYANKRMKDKALDLKNQIIEERKKEKEVHT